MTRYRFWILQVVLFAALVALWMAGPLQAAFVGDSAYFVTGVLCVGVIGLVCAGLGRIGDAERIQDLLPIIAVIAMQAGILSALAIMAQALMTKADPSASVGGFFSALSTAFYVSIAALTGYFWLRITLWLAHGK